MPIISINDIKNKQNDFKKEFTNIFNIKLKESHDIAIGLIPANIDNTPVGNIARNIIENLAASIPGIGSFASIIVSVIEQTYDYYQQRRAIQEAIEYNNYVMQLGKSIIDATLEETVYETARIFEYQIAMLKTSNDVGVLAKFAVDKIFRLNALSKFNFDRNNILKALVTEEDPGWFYERITLKTIAGFSWKADKVFTKPGLREEANGGSYNYHFKIGSSESAAKYGYRAKILFWNEASKSFTHSELDNGYTQSSPSNEDAQKYVPYMRLVSQNEIDRYYSIFLPEQRVLNTRASFSEFFNNANYKDPTAERLAVFREASFAVGSDLHNSDFSNVDMLRISFTTLNMQSCNFHSTFMMMSIIKASILDGSSLHGADLRWSMLLSSKLRGNTILRDTKLDYAFLDKDTDLTANNNVHNFLGISWKGWCNLATAGETVERIIQFTVPNVVACFTGRESQLDQAYKYFTEENIKIIIIGGISGVGKTQTALKYVEKHEHEYSSRVIWINAENQATLNSSFRRIAETLGMRIAGQADDKILEYVKSKLSTMVEKYLLIFDNTNSRELIINYLPNARGINAHHIIITTNNIQDWQISAPYTGEKIIKVDPFTQDEVSKYVRIFLPTASERDILDLATLFDNIPLGLSQSISYIRSNVGSIRDYIDEFIYIRETQLPSNLLSSEFETRDSGHTHNIYISTKMILERLRSNSKAIQLIKICSYLNADRIPENLFDDFFENTREKIEILSMLEGFSLISMRPERQFQFIYIHRIVQYVVRMSEENQLLESLFNAAELIYAKTNCIIVGEYAVMEIMLADKPLLNHIVQLKQYYQKELNTQLSLGNQDEYFIFKLRASLAELKVSCGNVYTICYGRLKDAFVEYRDAILQLTGSLIEEKKEFISSINDNIARVVHLGLQEAQAWQDQGSPQRLLAKNSENWFNLALAKYQEVLWISKEAYGERSKSTINIISKIGDIYKAQGAYREALIQYSNSLSLGKALYGNEDAKVITILSEIASIHEELRFYQYALDEYKEVLRMTKVVYGNDHPEALAPIRGIVRACSALGTTQDRQYGLEQLKEELRISKLSFGENSPAVQTLANVVKDVESSLQSSCIIACVTDFRFDNLILSNKNLLFEAQNFGGIKTVNALIDLGQDKELSSAIIYATETYGTKHVIDIIFGSREAGLDSASTKQDSQILMITENNQHMLEPDSAEFRPNNLMLPSFIVKEAIEALPTIKYFIKEVLQINYELPKFIDNNYFKLTSHFVICNVGAFAITGQVDIATASAPTAVYGGRILAYEYLSKQKQINFYSTEDKSIDNPIEFIQKCGFDIVLHTTFGVISGFISGNPVIIFDVAISATVGGMQCYKLYKSDNTQGNTKTSSETIIPYITDSVAYYSTVQNMHFDLTSTAGQILAVKQGFTILSTVVMTDYITKLAVSSIPEGLCTYPFELANSIYSYFMGETDNVNVEI